MNSEIIIAVIIGVFFLINLFVMAPYGQIYCKCWLSGAIVPFSALIAMKIRKVPVEKITDAYISCIKAGLKIEISELETEYLAAPDDFDLYVKERIRIEREKKLKS